MANETPAWPAAERRSYDLILVQLNSIEDKLDKLHACIDGTNGTPGLRIRVDRIEQDSVRQGKYHFIWGSAVISAIAAWWMRQ